MMAHRKLSACLVAACLLLAWTGSHTAAQSLPPDFALQSIGSGWSFPVGIAFIDGNRLLVAEKAGKLWFVENDVKKNLVLDLQREVLNSGDRGLIHVAVDPGFAQNGFIYLLLAVDPTFDDNEGDKETFARLVRYTTSYASGSLTADVSSRVNLIGDSWSTGFPSCQYGHTVGTLRFLSDGSLVCAAGDGAHFESVDVGGQDPGCFGDGKFTADQDIGAFRSQYLATLSGKVLRVDPATGLGLADNPFFSGDPSEPRSRVWLHGLRNPFKFALQPGTGPRETLFISDVGWNTWEEIDCGRGGENFGWPCYEGNAQEPSYQAADAFDFCSAGPFTPPILTWNHVDPGSLGFTGTCATGIEFYRGSRYPALYHDALFFCDFSVGWMKVAKLDANRQVTTVLPFASGLHYPVDMTTDPATGDLVYVALETNTIARIAYIGENAPPVAVSSADPEFGTPPLSVQFTASTSYDPEGGPLAFAWDFDDGTTASEADPGHVFVDERSYSVRLTLTDLQGGVTTQTLAITTQNTPPQITSLTSPVDGSFYTEGQPVTLTATATDAEDDPAQVPLVAVWHIDLVHDHHTHPDWLTVNGLLGSFVPESHGPGTYLRITLVVTDSWGASDSRQLAIYDTDTTPRPHLVTLSDFTPRLDQTIVGTGHVEYPGKGPAKLTWDWGDGVTDVFDGVTHQQDTRPAHAYGRVGTYQVSLTAEAGTDHESTSQTVVVADKQSAIAVFVPLVTERWVPWQQQQAIAAALIARAHELGHEGSLFYYSDQDALRAWVDAYTEDDVLDALFVIDLCPAALYAGEDHGALARRFLARGNGIVWTGAEPFFEYMNNDGSTSTQGAGADGASDVLGSAYPGLCSGSGIEQLTPLASRDLPSLTTFTSTRALVLDRVGAWWRLARLYATAANGAADAVVIENASGGFYAQFLCANDAALPRASVLTEFLANVLLTRTTRVALPPANR